MSAVWRAARAAVRRRRVQTTVIGVVTLCSTAMIVMALALLVATSAPFDRAFARQQGPHLVAAFDAAAVSDQQLAATAQLPGVEAVAGPFPVAIVEPEQLPDAPGLRAGPLTVVGRSDPAGPVDRMDLWRGRWVTGPGEIVLNVEPDPQRAEWFPLGEAVAFPDGRSLTVVGYAYSLSRTADAWVAPRQMPALRPTVTQLLYRFTEAATTAQVDAGIEVVTAGLPPDGLLATQSYLTIKAAVAAGPGVYVPFLLGFGVLGLVVSVLIVTNVVSGAVVAGFRHIGVLKTLGFTPRQVVGVYLTMVCLPATVGSVLGTLLGHLGTGPLLTNALRGLGVGEVGVSPWVDAAALLGMPTVVLLAALGPAMRAYRLSAAEAISAGSAPRAGRALRVQRWLSGTRLPRPVSLGIGLPFARPARTALTVATVALGVVTVTLAIGLTATVTRYADLTAGADTVGVRPYPPDDERSSSPRTDPEVEALLRSLTGTVHVTANLDLPVTIVGGTQPVNVSFLRGDAATLGFQKQLVAGRWWERAGELVAPSQLLNQRGLAVGDQLTLKLTDQLTTVTVVGETMTGGPGPEALLTSWQTLRDLSPSYRPAGHEILYQVEVMPGTDLPDYLAAITAADPGLDAWDNTVSNDFSATVASFSSLLTLMLATVAALGVFNTAMLNTRERRRDLGMLKSIGMTPRQVTVMVVSSMAALGAAGGIVAVPVGIFAHRLVVPVAARAAQVTIPESLLAVWQAPMIALLALAGVVIAGLGALLPARAAARLGVSKVLHTE